MTVKNLQGTMLKTFLIAMMLSKHNFLTETTKDLLSIRVNVIYSNPMAMLNNTADIIVVLT